MSSKAPPRRAASSHLVFGEHHYLYAKDVPVTKQRAANYLWVGFSAMLGVILRLAIQSETGKAPYSLGLVGAMWANALGCFLYGLVARTYFAENTPAAYAGMTTGFCGSLTTFSGWALDTAALFMRGNVARAILSLVAPLALFGAALEFGIFLGDTLEASSGAFDDEEDSSALSGRGMVDVLAPEEAKLPVYHTYKIHIGAALLGAFLAAAIALALAGPPWMQEPCVAAALGPVGAWLRYAVSARNRDYPLPYGTLASNVLATIAAGVAKGFTGLFADAVIDGFCGGLSTTSTFVSECRLLRGFRDTQAKGWRYAAMTLALGQAAAIPLLVFL